MMNSKLTNIMNRVAILVVIIPATFSIIDGDIISLYDGKPANVRTKLRPTLRYLPNDVKYYIYNKENPNAQQVLQSEARIITTVSSFNTSKDTVILIHGWINDINSHFCVINSDQYLASFDVNVIRVYWDRLSQLDYGTSRSSVPYVGNRVGQFIGAISSAFTYALTRFHIVGHSLGAHIGGFAGQFNNGAIRRITGLDPALPLFLESLPDQRLSEDDATFVDVIHSNSGTLGVNYNCGHADFYPNGGQNQPGCSVNVTCSHSRSFLFYWESLTTDLFISKSCSSYFSYMNGDCKSNPPTSMGRAYTDMTIRGTYYLETASDYPYALGDIGL